MAANGCHFSVGVSPGQTPNDRFANALTDRFTNGLRTLRRGHPKDGGYPVCLVAPSPIRVGGFSPPPF